MSTNEPKISPDSPYMTYEMCSKYIGISVWTLKQMVRRNEIPHHRPGNRRLVRFKRPEIDSWVEETTNEFQDAASNAGL